MNKFKQYIYNLLLAFDQFINVILLGDPDESISGRCGRAIKSNNPKFFVIPLAKFIDALFLVIFNEKNHILNAIEDEECNSKELWSWIKNG
jgi:hypothetical protein